MTNQEKTKIILNQLADEVINVDWNREDEYLRSITKALRKIESVEKSK
ncbi:hypothetical protein [Alkalibaculum sporogenes]|nr:hypothetical protein [Alkalibaculum sporogenes]